MRYEIMDRLFYTLSQSDEALELALELLLHLRLDQLMDLLVDLKAREGAKVFFIALEH